MVITEQLIEKLAHLSMLSFSAEEKIQLQDELEKMLGFIQKLEEADTEGVEPLLHLSEEINGMRCDEIDGEISRQEAFENAPFHNEEFFMVPKVIKK